jgi:hypothetical protein
MLNCANCTVSDNNFSSRFVGMITVFNGDQNVFDGNALRCPNDRSTSWLTGKDAWSATNYDPQNRDIIYGVVAFDGNSTNNIFSNAVIEAYISQPVNGLSNPVVIRVKSNASGNNFGSINMVGTTSTRLFTFESTTNSNSLDASVPNTSLTNTGSNRVLPPIYSGSVAPSGVVTAPTGSLYTNIAGSTSTTLYVKESGTGNTGWVAK